MPNNTTTRFSARKRLIVASIAACFASAPAWSNPTGPQVVTGGASFNQAGKLLTVNNTNGAIINWNTFSIGAGETTRFNQASAASSVLNRVIANDPSVLLGTLSSNGKVWLVNPAGIMVGQGAKIDVAGFIASTLNVANQDFLAGRLNFGATPNAGSIQNYGQITTPSGGSIYLVAPNIENHGIINAPNGEVILAAGQTAQLIDTGTPGVKVDITGAEGNVTNLGEIVAEAGRIGMAGVLVKNSGTLNASSLVKEGGRIFLKASQRIEIDEAGRILADGTKGGQIVAKTEADGQLSGKLIARGEISAQGNGTKGSGGFVETSARIADVNNARVNTRGGTWLLDPDDVEINSTGTISGATLVTPTTIGNALVNNDFVVQTNAAGTGGSGDIVVNGSVSWYSANRLTLNAGRDITVNQSITNNGAGGVNLFAGGSIVNASGISTYGSVNLLAKGAITFGNTSYSGYLDSNGSPITLVANWDGSTAVPGIAPGAQCAGAVFCGINGAGSIYSNHYYSSVATVGAVTLKAPGDIALSSIPIYARGNDGYYRSTSAGGAGGTVSITSTMGNLTTGSIDAGGGGGNSGSAGISSAVNGGTGGVGGAGGTINLSAAGTLTLGGTTNVVGGGGGGGGSGYYDYSTYPYTYTGTGGNGGAGGSAGTINASGASLVVSGATLNAYGGTGGLGGQGTTKGSVGAFGTASPVTLATAGDINLTGYSNSFNSSELNLFAGKSISFGTTGASPTYGNLNSYYGSPITLVANWNGSTTALVHNAAQSSAASAEPALSTAITIATPTPMRAP